MLEAVLWGLVASSSLLIGALIALSVRVEGKVLAIVLAFGAGVLISAVTVELTEDAFELGGGDAVAIGLVIGALAFYLLDRLVDRHATASRKRSSGPGPDASSRAIALGAVLDAVPESLVIGLGLIDHGGVSIAIIAAVFISNLPESIAATAGYTKGGQSPRPILLLWIGVMVASALCAGLGYGVLGNASPELIAFTQAFAGGALLTMLADSMVPEAFEHGGSITGVVTVLGFAAAFLLSAL